MQDIIITLLEALTTIVRTESELLRKLTSGQDRIQATQKEIAKAVDDFHAEVMSAQTEMGHLLVSIASRVPAVGDPDAIH